MALHYNRQDLRWPQQWWWFWSSWDFMLCNK